MFAVAIPCTAFQTTSKRADVGVRVVLVVGVRVVMVVVVRVVSVRVV